MERTWLLLIGVGAVLEGYALASHKTPLSHVVRKVPKAARVVGWAWVGHHFLVKE